MLELRTWIDLSRDVADSAQLDRLASALIPAGAAAPSPGEYIELCPYLGLDSFKEQHSDFFFGREQFSKDLLKKVVAEPVTALVGASGTGKSSVVQAGLVPLLREQKVNEGDWAVVTLTPGKQPFHHLAEALFPLIEPRTEGQRRIEGISNLRQRLAEGKQTIAETVREARRQSPSLGRVLIIVDQFEELFSLTPERAVGPQGKRIALRASFAEALVKDVAEADFGVLLSMRVDFLGQAFKLGGSLVGHLQRGLAVLSPMEPEGLRATIEKPAQVVGVQVERALVERLLGDLKKEPGNLALLEFALKELWDKRRGDRMEADSYQMGDVARAIADRAEKELKEELADPDGEKEVRSLLCRLVRASESGQDGDARDRAPLSELSRSQRGIVQKLSGKRARLLVTARDAQTGQETVEVAHEALIHNWPRLQKWVDADRKFLLWRQGMRSLRDSGGFLEGKRLREAKRWLNERAENLSQGERKFIQQSRRRARRMPMAIVALVLVIVLLAYLQWYLPHQERIAELKEQFKTAESEEAAFERITALDDAYTFGPVKFPSWHEADRLSLIAERRSFIVWSLEQGLENSHGYACPLSSIDYFWPLSIEGLTEDLLSERPPELASMLWALDRFCLNNAENNRFEEARERRKEVVTILRKLRPDLPKIRSKDWVQFPDEAEPGDLLELRFEMGSKTGGADEQPLHWVRLAPFRLLKHEVTNQEFAKFFPDWRDKPGDRPAVAMTWYQAYVFAAWLGGPDRAGRLPTEAEWEYAARSGGQTREYPWKECGQICNCAWVQECDRDGRSALEYGPLPVCSLQDGYTDQGVCDMAGNVWEWTADWYAPYPESDQPDGWGSADSSGGGRVIRGGSFNDPADGARASNRLGGDPWVWFSNLGFRVVLPAAPRPLSGDH